MLSRWDIYYQMERLLPKKEEKWADKANVIVEALCPYTFTDGVRFDRLTPAQKAEFSRWPEWKLLEDNQSSSQGDIKEQIATQVIENQANAALLRYLEVKKLEAALDTIEHLARRIDKLPAGQPILIGVSAKEFTSKVIADLKSVIEKRKKG